MGPEAARPTTESSALKPSDKDSSYWPSTSGDTATAPHRRWTARVRHPGGDGLPKVPFGGRCGTGSAIGVEHGRFLRIEGRLFDRLRRHGSLVPCRRRRILDALDDESDTEIEGDSDVVGDTEIEDDVGTESGSEARGGDSTGGVARQDQTTAAAGIEASPTPATTAQWDRPRLRSYFRQQDSRRLAAQVECPVLIVHARARTNRCLSSTPCSLPATYGRIPPYSRWKTAATLRQHDPAIHRYTVAWLRDRVTDTGKDHG